MKIGYVQNAPIFGKKEENFEEVDRLLGNVTADLIVLPELFATGYTFVSRKEAESLAEGPDGPTARFLATVSKRTKAVIVAGFVEKDHGRIYNSALVVSDSGAIDSYRKIHLFNREKLWFDPGDKPFGVYQVKNAKVGVMICFDWIFPEAARTLALRGADIIAHPSNLVLPYCQKAMTTRCLENRIFAVTANRIGRETRDQDDFSFTGASQITAINGTILSSAPKDASSTDFVQIDIEDARRKAINQHNDLFIDRRTEFYT
ncbi:MAG: acyltransferase [Proteobacteria bacterium]|nr:acyltransferase [Pseudomonadota bacterium]